MSASELVEDVEPTLVDAERFGKTRERLLRGGVRLAVDERDDKST